MDRSRRQGATTEPPASSKLTLKSRKNRRKPASVWSRMPPPRAIADACGRALRRSLPALAATGVLAAVGAAGYAGYRFVTTSPRFAIEDIQIRGASHEDAASLRARLPIHVGDNVFEAGLDDAARALLADPWIASADAHRILPHSIIIDVREHSAAAIADIGGLYLVDADGRPFKRVAIEAGDGAGLPVITGLDRASFTADPSGTAETIKTALATLQTWRSHGDRPAIGEVHVDHGDITLHTYDGAVAIQLGQPSPDLEARMATFDAAWADLPDEERARARAVHVDTQPDHVTIAFN